MHNSQWEIKPQQRNRSRVDLGLGTSNLVHCITGIEYVRYYTKKLDHKALYIDINKGTFEKPTDPPYKIPNKVLNNEIYTKKQVQKLILILTSTENILFQRNKFPQILFQRFFHQSMFLRGTNSFKKMR